jgi:hypothetical protein
MFGVSIMNGFLMLFYIIHFGIPTMDNGLDMYVCCTKFDTCSEF